MNTSSTESELSSVELRSRLFHTFKSKGVLQSVKSQLRNRLALELQNSFSKNLKQHTSNLCDDNLFLQVSNSLVLDHLKRCSYDYTLSVFITESLVNPEKALSLNDMLHLLKISPESKLHKKLSEASQKSTAMESFLYTFLYEFCDNVKETTRQISTQTDTNIINIPLTLDAKLMNLEKAMTKTATQEQSMEEKLMSYQRKYDAQKKTELQVEMERFKSTQLSLMKIEERDRYQKELEEMKNHYDENYQRKAEELDKKERELHNSSLKQEKMLENNAYEHRQKVLSELQQLKDRELEMEKSHKMAWRAHEMEEEKFQLRKQQLQYKEESVKDIEKRYEEKLQNEIMKVRFELQQQERGRVKNLQMQELQLREEKSNFEVQRDVYLRWKDEAEKLKEKTEQQHLHLVTSKQQIDALNERLQMLTEKYNKTDNYDQIVNLNQLLERDLALLRGNFENLKTDKAKREKEHKKLVKELLDKMSKSNELNMVEAKDKENKEKYFNDKFYSMQDKYRVEVSKNEELKRMNEDLVLSQRETLREINELQSALQLANREKEKYARMYNESTKIPVVRKGARSPFRYNIQQQPVQHVRDSWLNDNQWKSISLDGFHEPQEDRNEEDGDGVLQKLEKESMELEQSYKDFQDRQKSYQTKASLSRVQFDPMVHHRSTSTRDTNETTRTLEIRASDDSIKFLHEATSDISQGNSTIVSAYSSNENPTRFHTTQAQQVLCSTQTPGAVDACAPSFGCLSGVTRSNVYQDPYTTSINIVPRTEVTTTYSSLVTLMNPVTAVSTLPSCYSLTQHPLNEATTTVRSPSQYPLYDTRNSLTQYPLSDSAMTLEDRKVTFTEKNERKYNIGESVTPVTADGNSNNEVLQNHTQTTENSPEKDFDLKETSISTFESPLKQVNMCGADNIGGIMNVPAKQPSKPPVPPVLEDGNCDIIKTASKESSTSSKDDGSLKTKDLKTDDDLSEMQDNINAGMVNVFDDGEKKTRTEDNDDVMQTYMKMIMEKKHAEQTNHSPPNTKNNFKTDDIPLTDTDDNEKASEPTTSDYEW